LPELISTYLRDLIKRPGVLKDQSVNNLPYKNLSI
jgi:hypothetical protein